MARLPFAKKMPDGTVDYWAVKAGKDHDKDRARGRSYARKLIDEMNETRFPYTLGHVVSAMAGRPLTQVERGFFDAIAWECTAPWSGDVPQVPADTVPPPTVPAPAPPKPDTPEHRLAELGEALL